MADSVKNINKVRVVTNGSPSDALITVNGEQVQLTDRLTLADVILNSDGSVKNVAEADTDDLYIIKNVDKEITLNLNDDGIGVVVGMNNNDRVVTPLNQIIGVIGDENGTNFNTKVGLAPMSHNSATGAYGKADNVNFGHVKLLQDVKNVPADTTGLALGAGILETIAGLTGATFISKTAYNALGDSAFSDDKLYYIYDETDLAAGLSRIKVLYSQSAGSSAWDSFYANRPGCLAYDFVTKWWGEGAYNNLVLNGSYSGYIPSRS